MRLPSGDHVGALAPSNVNRVGAPRATSYTHSSRFSPTAPFTATAIFCPSGEMRAFEYEPSSAFASGVTAPFLSTHTSLPVNTGLIPPFAYSSVPELETTNCPAPVSSSVLGVLTLCMTPSTSAIGAPRTCRVPASNGTAISVPLFMYTRCPGADVARVGAPGNEHARFAAVERLQHDARLLPSPCRSGPRYGRLRKEDRVAPGSGAGADGAHHRARWSTAVAAPPAAETLKIPASRAKTDRVVVSPTRAPAEPCRCLRRSWRVDLRRQAPSSACCVSRNRSTRHPEKRTARRRLRYRASASLRRDRSHETNSWALP